MSIVWPNSIPFINTLNGLSESGPADNILRTQMSAGRAKTRRRSSNPAKFLNGIIFGLTKSDLNVFEEFFEDDLSQGALSFVAEHPRLGQDRTFRFMGSYEIGNINNELFTISVSLEFWK